MPDRLTPICNGRQLLFYDLVLCLFVAILYGNEVDAGYQWHHIDAKFLCCKSMYLQQFARKAADADRPARHGRLFRFGNNLIAWLWICL